MRIWFQIIAWRSPKIISYAQLLPHTRHKYVLCVRGKTQSHYTSTTLTVAPLLPSHELIDSDKTLELLSVRTGTLWRVWPPFIYCRFLVIICFICVVFRVPLRLCCVALLPIKYLCVWNDLWKIYFGKCAVTKLPSVAAKQNAVCCWLCCWLMMDDTNRTPHNITQT